jgi:transcriptional regulator with XRE-family HTH domain
MIDKEKALIYLSQIIETALQQPNITSEEQLAKILGCSQGTINKLKLRRFARLPDHDTLMAIANYINQPYWKFIKSLEENYPIEPGEENSYNQLVGRILKISNVNLIIKLNIVIVKHLEMLLMARNDY